MSRLSDIRVAVVPATPEADGNARARAVLSEIAALLDALLAHGTPGAIDLLTLPLSVADRAALDALLGRGEVTATIEVNGPSRVHETAFAGVWRVTHESDDGQVIADTIEVAFSPAILQSHPADVEAGLRRLRVQQVVESESRP